MNRRRSESLNLGGAFRALREGAIYETFVLVGLSPTAPEETLTGSPVLEPTVLFNYPPSNK
jgi:hypothetical protein